MVIFDTLIIISFKMMDRVAQLSSMEEDDLYSGYNEYPTIFDVKDLEKDEIFQAALLKSSHGKKNLV